MNWEDTIVYTGQCGRKHCRNISSYLGGGCVVTENADKEVGVGLEQKWLTGSEVASGYLCVGKDVRYEKCVVFDRNVIRKI